MPHVVDSYTGRRDDNNIYEFLNLTVYDIEQLQQLEKAITREKFYLLRSCYENMLQTNKNFKAAFILPKLKTV